MQPSGSNRRTTERGKNQAEAYADMLVEDLNIPDALARRLTGRGIITVGQLLTMCENDIRGYWIGKGSIQKIQSALTQLGFEPLGRNAPRQKIRRTM
jgi:hypothetical protein